MTDLPALPEPIEKAQKSLRAYIKQRQEAALIRRFLALHLNSYINHDQEALLPRPLSLLHLTSDVDSPAHGIRGLQKEYLRCAHANFKARKQYTAISREHRATLEGDNAISKQDVSEPPMECFIDTVKQRQKHERLRIHHDYVDTLSQKPVAASEHLDPSFVLKDVAALPKVPPEVFNGPSTLQVSGGTDLNALLDELEKSVLRAKLLLKREQKLLEKIRYERNSSESLGGRLQALASTRDELITWIEAELARASESSPEVQGEDLEVAGSRGKEYIDTQLAAIQRQYTRYTKSRRKLILAATRRIEIPHVTTNDEEVALTPNKEPYNSSGIEVTLPHLEQMLATASEQKDIIQQKSHLTISLAKQLKEAGLGLDRLADESHLLPSYPLPTGKTQRKGLEVPSSFADEMLSNEKPDSSHRARAWVFASEQAERLTKTSVSQKLEEGGVAIDNAHETLAELQRLLGGGSATESKSNGAIWGTIDRSLGVIKGDVAD
jgi:hypothetical protein